MPGSTREIKRRIRGVKNIRQITRAMELVSAAKMQRAVSAVQRSRRYASLAWDMLLSVTSKLRGVHPLLNVRPIKNILIITVSSNRGLAGGYNTKVSEAARQYVAGSDSDVEVSVVALGKKGRDYLMKRAVKVVADFERDERGGTVVEVTPIVRLAFDGYLAGTYDEVAVAYTDFVSMLRQEPRVRRLLPLKSPDEMLGHTMHDEAPESVTDAAHHVFEPDAATLLNELVPRLLEMQLYQAVQEANASEHAARMLAMRNASDAAKDLSADLTLTLNQLRQGGITRELAEISAGRMAIGA
ncbi:MAG: ATP synthase F1 subunit gamma [Patescibacteria group bacterium]